MCKVDPIEELMIEKASLERENKALYELVEALRARLKITPEQLRALRDEPIVEHEG